MPHQQLDNGEPEPLLRLRERQVLELICEGHGNKEIAFRLGISQRTAENHRAKLMAKTEVYNSLHLFRWALIKGLVSMGGRPPQPGPAKPVPFSQLGPVALPAFSPGSGKTEC
jgi:DNA-binding CsgD family transcriptional regulator